MFKRIRFYVGILGMFAFLAYGGVAHAATDTHANGVVICNNVGLGECLNGGTHGSVVTTGGSALFNAVDIHSGVFELENTSNDLCLTVDVNDLDLVKYEGCGGATSTLWGISGDLYQSVVLVNEGVTGNMTSNPVGFCNAGDTGAIVARGGIAAGNCSIEWSGPF